MYIKTNDIDAAHRIGKPRGDKPPAIIVRFFRRDHRDQIIVKRRELRGTGYGITEDLTRLNLLLINRAKLHTDITSAWSWNGSVWALTTSGHKIKLEPFDVISKVIGSRQRHGNDRSAPPHAEPSVGTAVDHENTV